MFNGIHFLTKPKKNIQDQLFKKYLYDSINKHNKLSIYIDEDNKKKQNYQNIISKNNSVNRSSSKNAPSKVKLKSVCIASNNLATFTAGNNSV